MEWKSKGLKTAVLVGRTMTTMTAKQRIEQQAKQIDDLKKTVDDLLAHVQEQTDIRAKTDSPAQSRSNIAKHVEPSSNMGCYDVLTKYRDDVKLTFSGKKAFFITFDRREANKHIPRDEWLALDQKHGKKGIWRYKNAVYVMANNADILGKIAKCGVEIPQIPKVA